MKGLVLCGGQSARMGQDKALLQLHNLHWADRAGQLLEALSLPVLLSVNPQQQASYACIFKQELVIDNATLSLKGPLLGLLSAHRLYPSEDFFVLACDMICMHTTVLQTLLQLHNEHRTIATVFSREMYAEPLCGIYTADGLQQLDQFYQQHPAAKQSLQFALVQLQAPQFPLPEAWHNAFANANSPAELAQCLPLSPQHATLPVL